MLFETEIPDAADLSPLLQEADADADEDDAEDDPDELVCPANVVVVPDWVAMVIADPLTCVTSTTGTPLAATTVYSLTMVANADCVWVPKTEVTRRKSTTLSLPVSDARADSTTEPTTEVADENFSPTLEVTLLKRDWTFSQPGAGAGAALTLTATRGRRARTATLEYISKIVKLIEKVVENGQHQAVEKKRRMKRVYIHLTCGTVRCRVGVQTSSSWQHAVFQPMIISTVIKTVEPRSAESFRSG
ncbi:hypothetical protein BC629DRAFT_1493320 [Irpex lacteus]|nr:hypothetical protein BC629DRAFT_1493320 [Irpex lacteus]